MVSILFSIGPSKIDIMLIELISSKNELKNLGHPRKAKLSDTVLGDINLRYSSFKKLVS